MLNPENLIVGACNFYIDPTHKSPISLNTLKWLAEERSFVNVDILRLHPFKELNHSNSNIDKNIKYALYFFNKG